MSRYDVQSVMGQIDALRSDEYSSQAPMCLVDAIDIPRDQLNTAIHEVMVLNIPVTEEEKVVAISGVIQPRTRKRK